MEERVRLLKLFLTQTKVDHEEIMLRLTSLKDAHVYCVLNQLSAQQYGPLLEKFIRKKFGYVKNKSTACTGDASKDGKNSEIKVSLGTATRDKFNFVQIRPAHNCDIYVLTAYYLSLDNVDSEGELYIFKVPKEEINRLVVSFGGYAHGTLKEHGTVDSTNKEYALRPRRNDGCWHALLPFRVPETDL